MTSRKLMAVATVAGAMALPLAAALPAHAQSSGTQSYQANLQPVPLNGAAQTGAGGTAGLRDLPLLVGGGALLAGAAGFAVRKATTR